MVTICITLVLTFFLLVSGEGPLQRITMMARTFSARRQIVRIVRDLERNTARYILTLSIINFFEFLAVSLVLMALGIPKPWAMGFIAGLFNFVPYLGPIVAASLIFASTAVDTGELGSGVLATSVFPGHQPDRGVFHQPDGVRQPAADQPDRDHRRGAGGFVDLGHRRLAAVDAGAGDAAGGV